MVNGTKQKTQKDGTEIDYPDLMPDGLGQLKDLKRIKGLKKNPPRIKWGADYQKWTQKKRMKYAEHVANAMNHAADMLQKERDALLKVVKDQEKKLKAYSNDLLAQGQLMMKQVTDSNAEKQKANQEIVDTKMKLIKLQREHALLKKQVETSGANLD